MKKLTINNRRYLGSKYKLLDFIDETIKNNCGEYNSVFDVFGGTGVVSNYFSEKGKKIYINDILKSNYCIYRAFLGNEKFSENKIKKIIDEYNKISDMEENYFSKNYKNTYFSENDCKKIGYIREDINKKFENKEINEREKYILIASLLYSMDKIANTVGHYDAYRKKQKLDDCFEMYNLDINKNQTIKNEIYNMDSNELAKKIKADIIYIDPPYNSRQYGDAYHLLENVAEWKKPKVYGVAKKMDRSKIKSNYCTNKASNAFKDLIKNCNCKYIIVSYNNMGQKGNSRSQAKISDTEILEILNQKGKVKVFEQDFNFFTTGKTHIDNHKERLFLCEVCEQENEEPSYNANIISEFAKSPLNYVGGKYKLLNQLTKKFPSEVNTFVDYFCGGGNVGVNINAKKVIAVDKEKYLINVLNLFKNYSYTEIIDKLDNIIEKYKLSNTYINGYDYYKCDSSSGLGSYNKQRYLKLRNDYNKMKEESDEKTFKFLVLIIYGFNHQIRFNSSGEFNMPVGKRDFNGSIRKNLLAFCEKLKSKNVEFISEDFKKFKIDNLTSEDFCYFDPPYFLGDASYNENNNWTEKDEKDLLNYINKLNEKNIKFALSNVTQHRGEKNNILIDWAIENKYNINYLDYNYNNSNYHSKSKLNVTEEVLITNYSI